MLSIEFVEFSCLAIPRKTKRQGQKNEKSKLTKHNDGSSSLSDDYMSFSSAIAWIFEPDVPLVFVITKFHHRGKLSVEQHIYSGRIRAACFTEYISDRCQLVMSHVLIKFQSTTANRSC